MSKKKKTVIIGILGSTLDAASWAKEERWARWRPSISLCQQDDLLVNRFDLLFEPKFEKLAELTKSDITKVSPETTVQFHHVESEDWWDFEKVYGLLFDFIRNYKFDTQNEDYLIHITTGTHVAQICLFLLTESHWIPARLLQSEPPKGRRGDIGTYRVIDLDLSTYDIIAERFKQGRSDAVSYLKNGIVTRNDAFNHLIERIEQVAMLSSDPVLITGPTGAGKSQLARRIYELKKNRGTVKGAFVEVNSATLRGDQAMSTLFGHVKGSFTGATVDRPGLLKKADKGMLFLDEIGDLNPDEQAMLLRALEDKRFLPVGADAEVQSDFQLIAGTNHNLLSDVVNGTFRDDLLARINLWTFELPSLRKRPEDIEPNIEFELHQFASKTNKNVTFNREARELFLCFAKSSEATWRGNFRDLNGAIRRMATLSDGGRITENIVKEEISRLKSMWGIDFQNMNGDLIKMLSGNKVIEEIDRFDRVQLEDVLKVCKESRSLSEAGRTLFSQSRVKKQATNDADRLRKYLAKFGLTYETIVNV
jgi:transcriptional regulatory protein RtcR